MNKVIKIIAGPNGSGKTTFAETFLVKSKQPIQFLNKVSLNISRIKKRVEQGGHHIPTNTVRRRHLRCFENFWTIYRLLSDEWIILDNSKTKPQLIQKSELFNKMSKDEQIQFSKKAVKGFS